MAESRRPVGRLVEETEEDMWTRLRTVQVRVEEQRFERLPGAAGKEVTALSGLPGRNERLSWDVVCQREVTCHLMD